MTDQPTTCPAATWAGLTICVTCPTPEPGTACAREPDALLRAATARTTPDSPAASNEPACGDTKWHPPHRYMRGGKIGECRGAEAADEPCDGCNHPPHAANQCSTVIYGERCVCDEGPPAASNDGLRDAATKPAEARRMSCNHDITSRCDHCSEPERAWRTELATAYRDLQLAIAHDRQPYPTAWAYEQACQALREQRSRANAATAALREVLDQFAVWPAGGTFWPEPGVVAKVSAEEWDRWDAVITPTDEPGPADTTPPAEDPSVDTCRPVQVGGETIHVHGARPLTGLELGYAAQIVAAARRKLAVEPSVVPDDDGTESALTRRIRARQRGEEAAEPERRTACGHDITSRCPDCRVREAEAKRQLNADPHGLEAGMIVKPYTERGQKMWVFRCWGTDTCDGWLSLDHSSEQSAERARDRHVAEEHAAPTTKEA